MKSIRKKYLIVEYIFISLILGIPALFFILAAKPYCIQKSQDSVEDVYEVIKDFDLNNLTEDNYKYIKDCESSAFRFAIGYMDNGDMTVVYGTSFANRISFAELYYKRKLEKATAEYTANPKAALTEKGDVKLRGLVEQNGKTYYVIVKQSLRVLISALKYLTIAFSGVVVLAFLLGNVLIAMFSRKLTQPIKKIERVSRKIANLDFSEKLIIDSKLTEIDNLSESINTMSVRLQKYLSDLENYNYCLREENFSASKLESQRQSCVNSISHELKTPLAIVSSQLALIQDLPSTVNKDNYFESINEEIEKMSGLISMLLNNSFDLYSYDGNLKPVNVSSIMKEIINKYEYLFDYNGQFCTFEIADDCYIMADAKYLEMAIHNYIINAVEHTEESGIVNIKLMRKDDKVQISVYNQGNCIPEDIMDSIWNRYFRQTKEEFSNQGNIGMGLSIVKSVVNIHHGECYAENEVDGVTFFMEFDVCKENDNDSNKSSQ